MSHWFMYCKTSIDSQAPSIAILSFLKETDLSSYIMTIDVDKALANKIGMLFKKSMFKCCKTNL